MSLYHAAATLAPTASDRTPSSQVAKLARPPEPTAVVWQNKNPAAGPSGDGVLYPVLCCPVLSCCGLIP